MKITVCKNPRLTYFNAALVFIALFGVTLGAKAAVSITNDWTTLLNLEKPTGKFDEPSLSGIEYQLSGKTGVFGANDQYLIYGEETLPETSLVADLGGVAELSGTAFDFSLQHNLSGGRNFTFSLDAGAPSVLCWGDNCAVGSTSAPTLGGQAPITQYNGLQIQVRAQEVVGASTIISNLALTGVVIAPGSAALFDGAVDMTTPSTIPGDPPGRIGQWLLGDNLDLVTQEWQLTGTVTLIRNDLALEDVTKVRLAVDFVNDLRLPLLQPVPLPASAWLFVSAVAGLAGLKRRRL